MEKIIQHLDSKTIFEMKNAIEYQEGSVASLTLVNKPQIGLTVFAFDEGEGISTHSAPGDAMVQILEGEAKITIADEVYHLKAGEFVIMPHNVPHAVESITRFKMLLTLVKNG